MTTVSAKTTPCSASITTPTPWRLWVDGALSGEENMRRDQELLEGQRDPAAVPVVRFFRWAAPTVSFGRLQPRAGAESLAKAAGAGSAVQRPTGGGMVLHDRDLSFSIAWRRDLAGFPPCVKEVYRSFHGVVADLLCARGMDVAVHQPSKRLPIAPGVCFKEPADQDLLWCGEKVLGGALRVTRWGRLYQGDVRTEVLGLDPDELVQAITNGLAKKVFLTPPGKEQGGQKAV